MTYRDGKYTCDGCRGERDWRSMFYFGVPVTSDSLPELDRDPFRHYCETCWQTGWYTGIEPKGEWPVTEEPEPSFDHVKGEVRTVSRTGGEKGVKPARFDLVPVGPLTTVAKLYGKGAAKYDDHNWMRGYEWSKSYAALMRHVTQFWGGEDLDPDTQLPHLASVVFHAFALMHYMDEHRSFDDRPRVANDDSVK